MRLGELDNAIADYDAALKLNPKLAASLYGRGLAKLKKGDTGGGNADITAAKAIQGYCRRVRALRREVAA